MVLLLSVNIDTKKTKANLRYFSSFTEQLLQQTLYLNFTALSYSPYAASPYHHSAHIWEIFY